MSEARVAVCLCPGGDRHPDGEVLAFKDQLGFRDVMGFQKALGWFKDQEPGADVPEVLAFLSEWYLLHCIASWSLLDAKGKPLPISKANVETYVLSKPGPAIELANVADEQYTEVLLLPLAIQASSSSRPTPTNGSTSATPGNGRRPRRSKPSSIASTPTAAIATT